MSQSVRFALWRSQIVFGRQCSANLNLGDVAPRFREVFVEQLLNEPVSQLLLQRHIVAAPRIVLSLLPLFKVIIWNLRQQNGSRLPWTFPRKFRILGARKGEESHNG